MILDKVIFITAHKKTINKKNRHSPKSDGYKKANKQTKVSIFYNLHIFSSAIKKRHIIAAHRQNMNKLSSIISSGLKFQNHKPKASTFQLLRSGFPHTLELSHSLPTLIRKPSLYNSIG